MLNFETHRVLAADGALVGTVPDLGDEQLVDAYRLMVLCRTVDRKAYSAQRQGRLGTYPMLEGHEAAQVGSALAFGPEDFLYPGYRELGLQIARGMPLDVLLTYWRGLPNVDWDPHRFGMMSISVPIGSHLPHAVGHAYQSRLDGNPVVTGAFVGDGGTSENDFHSGLNFAGVWRTPTVFICQNNFYAISVPYEKQTASATIAEKAAAYGIAGIRVDGMDVLAVYTATKEAVDRARSGGGPTLIEATCYRFGAHATADDARRYREESEEEVWRAKDPLVRMERFLQAERLISEDTRATYEREAGEAFDIALQDVESKPLPSSDDIIVHAYSKIPPAYIEQLHTIERARGVNLSEFRPDAIWQRGHDRVLPGPTEAMTMADAINRALYEALEEDPAAVVLGEDVGIAGGVFRITEGLQDRFGEERVIDTPLNESGIIGTAIGMAVAGGRPIAEIQFDGFVYPAFDQIVSHLGRVRYRTRGHLSMPVVVRFPSGAGIGAHEHHCDSPESYFLHAPGLVVVIPSNPYEAKGLLTAAIRSNDPVIFLEPKALYRSERQDVPIIPYEIPLGRARVARPGSDATLVTYGRTAPLSVSAADRLGEDGIEVEVIDLRTISPWDVETVMRSVSRTSRVLIVHEAKRSGGVGAEIAAEVGERCGWDLDAPVRRLTGTDAPWPQFAIESHALVTSDMIESELRSLMRD